MSTIKVSTFNSESIRNYMEGSDILDTSIAYMKAVNPGISDAAAKEAAIRQAQEFCHRKWANDSTGYISNEAVAWQEFAADVRKGRYFSVASIPKSSPKKRWIAIILCLFLGYAGAHRFYVGKWKTGLVWLCTMGAFGWGYLIDLFRLWSYTFEDVDGYVLD